MPVQFALTEKFTRAEIEWQLDELALKFQRTSDRKVIAQIAGLTRLLARLDGLPERPIPKNRQ